MAIQQQQLALERCPYCSVAKPQLSYRWEYNTAGHSGGNQRHWVLYCCVTCGGLVLTASKGVGPGPVTQMYPASRTVDESVPPKAYAYLTQAIDSLNAPAGAIMLTASAVDAMLKAKSYKEGSLDSRIKKAAADPLITPEMEAWAHEVRLDANDQRHADEDAQLPKPTDAERTLEFALALAEFLFVLPERVSRGRAATSSVLPVDARV